MVSIVVKRLTKSGRNKVMVILTGGLWRGSSVRDATIQQLNKKVPDKWELCLNCLLLKRNELAAKNKTIHESSNVAGECGKKGKMKKNSFHKGKVNCCKLIPAR